MSRQNAQRRVKVMVAVLVAGVLLGLGAYVFSQFRTRIFDSRSPIVMSFILNPSEHRDLVIPARTRCNNAPFIFPTTGMAGYLWGDSFRAGHTHQGVDIFAGTDVGIVHVINAYPGYLTRLPDWKSSVVVRIPDDPLHPGRQIWVYYTHMATAQGESLISSEFPPGTKEKYVEAATFLGYQGNYSGHPNNPVGVHLHISVVQDDGAGHFKNELDINNTYDPSPYLGLRLNASQNPSQIPVCESEE